MATNLDIDQRLLVDAVRMGRHDTKKAAVNAALLKYVQFLKQQRILSAFGTVDFAPDWDYKKMRRRR
ncbi:MAG: type II toxin-antitoxin system VapB family antitoxin [Phycisphaerae bacterium]